MCIRSVHNIISIIIEWKYGFVKFFFHNRKKLLFFVNYSQRNGSAAGMYTFLNEKAAQIFIRILQKEKK
jgi:hypothetical protein